MKFNEKHWSGTYFYNKFPRFKCPNCKEGRLLLTEDALSVCMPEYSAKASKWEEWEYEWTVERFSAKLLCDDSECGEVVFVTGDTVTELDYDQESKGLLYRSFLRPKYFFPAPPIIDIPDEVPHEVKEEIGLATELFWADFSSSANRVRVSVEKLLDHFKVIKTKKDKKGKSYRLDLNERIAIFKVDHKDHASTLTALRMIGNLGSHGSSVSRNALLDAFRIYEDSLNELFGTHKAVIDKLREKLIDTKGEY